VPARFAPGTSYTIGFWLLQHGTHPYWGDERSIGTVALRFVPSGGRDSGAGTVFTAVKLAEPAHYAAAVALPGPGEYRVEAVQGWFAPHEIGTLSVPGELKIIPLKQEVREAIQNHRKDYWTDVRPPGFPVMEVKTKAEAGPDGGIVLREQPAASGAAEPTGRPGSADTTVLVERSAHAGEQVPWWRTPYALLAGALVAGALGALTTLAVLARRRRAGASR
jgi:hypothetical protein